MKYDKDNTKSLELDNILQKLLDQYRGIRNFDVESYITLKCKLINDYMKNNNLDCCILGMSGGVDSAVTLALLNLTSQQTNSPIKHILPVNLPANWTTGVTNQTETYILSKELCDSLDVSLIDMDMGSIVQSIKDTFKKTFKSYYINPSDGSATDTQWSEGQMVSYVRTSLLYYLTAIYTDQNMKALLVGTTNRDEISYIGFYGKASDGMVDLQPISDIHKSEVYQVAEYFKIPESIIKRKPNGDMYHGQTDEEFFGFSYDFLELYTYYLTLPDFLKKLYFTFTDLETQSLFDKYKNNVENLHSYNAHKYNVGSPAIHLDIYDSKIVEQKENKYPKDTKYLVGYNATRTKPYPWKSKYTSNFYDEINKLDLNKIECREQKHKEHEGYLIYHINNFLTDFEVNNLLAMYNKFENKEVATVTGYVHSRRQVDKSLRQTGSIRASIYDIRLAYYLYERLSGLIPKIKEIMTTNDDNNAGEVWKHVGISPYFRFIDYFKDCYLLPHYDAPFVYDDKKMTLMSIVLCLTDNYNCSGNTVFLNDKDLLENNHSIYNDYVELFKPSDRGFDSSIPRKGNCLVFDHRILHQVSPILDSNKISIRTDLIYERMNIK